MKNHVLPLLAEHGGVLQSRLRSADGLVEIHVVCFPLTHAFARFWEDPRHVSHGCPFGSPKPLSSNPEPRRQTGA
jgi:hypothetical protein